MAGDGHGTGRVGQENGNRAKDTGKAQRFGIGKGEEDGNRAGGVGYDVMV